MEIIDTKLKGVKIIKPRVFGDDRGHFLETFHAPRYNELLGIELYFVQDNLSFSKGNVLRGLHAQQKHPQGKLVRCTSGEVFDVAADIDPASGTFGQWVGIVLTALNHKQIWIPPGYAHGFAVMSSSASFEYKCTDVYRPADEIGIIWNDTKLNIDWPITNPLLSESDASLPTLEEFCSK